MQVGEMRDDTSSTHMEIEVQKLIRIHTVRLLSYNITKRRHNPENPDTITFMVIFLMMLSHNDE
jgi:hypothetical protein